MDVQQVAQKRAQLVQKMQAEKQSGGATQKPTTTRKVHFHCDDIVGMDVRKHLE